MKSNNKILRAVTVSESVEFYTPIVKNLQEKGYEVVSVSSSGPELDLLRKDGIKVIEVPMERHISLIKDLLSFKNLVFIFRKEKPRMVHSMTPKAGLLCMIASYITHVPIRVHTFTGLVWPTAKGLTRRILMFTDWLTCACATHIIPEGDGVLNDLHKHITKKPMKVLGYGNVRGVDMTRFSKRDEVLNLSESLIKNTVFTFIFVGRIVGDKGINELIEAFLELLKVHNNIRLFLVGNYEQDLDPILKLTKDRIDSTPEIKSVGPKFGDELLAYYASSDCFVFPSYREGFPNTVMEAGAMDLPSIVTDTNGSREIIENGKNGVIIPSKDVDSLYKAMRQMIEDKDAYNTMVANARPMIESRFEQSFVRKCLLDFYEEIM
ncbi:glycosyltransferase family 1 protein [Bacteroides caccae]|jgi:glycosyltransferase involved in cell wall biosynthesis|nr:glycosyltransferase family 1 protein [Bacteroides caccae]